MWKETIFPPKYPGGGGWSIQRLSLSTLYTAHKEQMNYWTKSNDRLNLCRFMGVAVYLFREPNTDYLFTYLEEEPKHVPKYYYCSFHPMRLLTHKRKVTVPSFRTQPHKRKPYKKIFIKPPKLMKNQWFFQQHLSQYSLLTFVSTACSLTNMFGSDKATSNNCTIWCIDTAVFTSPFFQFKATKPTWGYQIAGQQFLWGINEQAHEPGKAKFNEAIYLGNTLENKRGSFVTKQNINKFEEWGNPFFWTYLTRHMQVFQTTATQSPDTFKDQLQTTEITEARIKQTPLVFPVRYNPYKDKGTGNQLYVVPNYLNSKNNWEPTTDPDLLFENYPLWLMLWGFEDMLKRIGKTQYLDQNWTVVFKSPYMSQKENYFVPVSYDFILGKGAYNTDHDELSGDDLTLWYPRFKYQRQALNNIVMTGPAVPTGDLTQNVQATMKYHFFFKWGGNSSPQESIYDPVNQPVTPIPNQLQFYNEIINPATSITGEIYPWDFRRDFLTDSATKRIQESLSNVLTLFTDGSLPQEATQDHQTTPQEEETPETQEETLFKQLQQIQQFNNQLQLRLQHLKQSFMDQ